MAKRIDKLRFVEVFNGDIWVPWCVCYKDEIIPSVRLFNLCGVVKYRFRLAGSHRWYIDFA